MERVGGAVGERGAGSVVIRNTWQEGGRSVEGRGFHLIEVRAPDTAGSQLLAGSYLAGAGGSMIIRG